MNIAKTSKTKIREGTIIATEMSALKPMMSIAIAALRDGKIPETQNSLESFKTAVYQSPLTTSEYLALVKTHLAVLSKGSCSFYNPKKISIELLKALIIAIAPAELHYSNAKFSSVELAENAAAQFQTLVKNLQPHSQDISNILSLLAKPKFINVDLAAQIGDALIKLNETEYKLAYIIYKFRHAIDLLNNDNTHATALTQNYAKKYAQESSSNLMLDFSNGSTNYIKRLKDTSGQNIIHSPLKQRLDLIKAITDNYTDPQKNDEIMFNISFMLVEPPFSFLVAAAAIREALNLQATNMLMSKGVKPEFHGEGSRWNNERFENCCIYQQKAPIHNSKKIALLQTETIFRARIIGYTDRIGSLIYNAQFWDQQAGKLITKQDKILNFRDYTASICELDASLTFLEQTTIIPFEMHLFMRELILDLISFNTRIDAFTRCSVKLPERLSRSLEQTAEPIQNLLNYHLEIFMHLLNAGSLADYIQYKVDFENNQLLHQVADYLYLVPKIVHRALLEKAQPEYIFTKIGINPQNVFLLGAKAKQYLDFHAANLREIIKAISLSLPNLDGKYQLSLPKSVGLSLNKLAQDFNYELAKLTPEDDLLNEFYRSFKVIVSELSDLLELYKVQQPSI